MAKLRPHATGGVVRLTSEGCRVCTNIESAQPVLNRLRHPSTEVVVYDCETTGLDWRKDSIVGHVFTFSDRPDDTWYIPVRHGGGGNILDYSGRNGHPFEVELASIASTRRDLHWIGHHFNFDLMFKWAHGIEVVGTVEDTEVNAALLNEFAGSYSLEACCLATGTTPKKGEVLYRHLAQQFSLPEATRRATMGSFWKLSGDDDVGTDYATGDGVSTWNLRERQLELLDKDGLIPIWETETRITRVVYRMKRRGVLIDRPQLDRVTKQVRRDLAKAAKRLPKDFNVRAPSQIVEYLTANGITDWPLLPPTPKMRRMNKLGNPSFNEAWLSTHEPGRNIVTVRKYRHLDDSFITPLIERHIGEDGRVHADFNQMRADDFGTVTGRFSSSEPNLQQVPKRNYELGVLFRSAFIPDPGMVWWDADLSQCEPRLLAHYSGAKVLLEGYLSDPPVDAHTAVAVAANLDREDGKRLNQTLLTGGGVNSIKAKLGDERGQEVYDQYFTAMPEIRVLQKNAARTMRMRGYVTSLMGRRARLDDPQYAYKAVNRLLQCGNADIIKDCMVKIDAHLEENGDTVNMLNTVHDALAFQALPEDEPIVREAFRLMVDYGPNCTFPLRVPMGLEIGRGKNWSEATYTKDKEYLQL